MPFSRSQNKETLDRIIRDVFEDDNEDGTPGPIRLALANVAIGVTDVAAMTSDEVENLTYKDDTGTSVPLKKYEVGILKTLKGFIYYQDSIGSPLRSMDDWTDHCTFNDFRVSTSWIVLSENGLNQGVATMMAGTTTGTTGTRSTVTPPRDPVYDFKRGIKRDISAYSDLKHDKGWDNWNRGLIAQARAQDLSDVLNPQFKPTDPIDKELFAEKQKFMYAVFEKHLQSDKGKALVRNYHKDADAQAVYRDLCEYAVNSTKASMGSRDLLTYITSSRLGDGKWKGGTHAYILHWQDQLRKYQDLIDIKDHFSADVKRVMLENAVSQVPELRAVKVNADLARTQTGKHLTYNQYCALLSSAAQQYDDQFVQANARPSKNVRSVYSHDISDMEQTVDTEYDIDMDVEQMVQVHNVNFSRGPRLQRDQWDRLGNISPTAQATWDTLSNEAKKIILEPKKPRDRIPRHTSNDANLHEISAHDFLELYTHRTSESNNGSPEMNNGERDIEVNGNGDESTAILAHMTKRAPLPPGDIQRVLSTSMDKTKPDKGSGTEKGETISINGKEYRLVNMTKVTYRSGVHRHTRQGALVDRGANGGIAGDDVRVIDTTSRQVDVQGIDNHQIVDIPIVTAGAVVKTQRGEAIIIMHQYAYTGKGKTIHSSGQLEWFKQRVDERSIKVPGGLQRITTVDGYVIPINIRSGLPYITMRPFTDHEWDTLPHIILTAPEEWTPSVLDHTLDDDEQWFDAVSDMPDTQSPFDEFGEYRHMHVIHEHHVSPHDLERHVIPTTALVAKDDTSSTPDGRQVTTRDLDYHGLRPHFAWLPVNVVQKTIENTTQYARMPMSTYLKKHYKAPNPAFNVPRRNEAVGTDMVYSDTPAVDSGETVAQLFIGIESLVADVDGMKTDSQFLRALLDNIRRRGAPTRLLSDRAQVEISNKVQDVLRTFAIGDWQSEPHQQHQNPAERRYQDIKRMANTCMGRTGSPPHTWLLALKYVCYVLNYTAHATLNWQTPMTILTGSTSDSSILLRFAWWDPVYYKLDDADFPSESPERRGRFVGFSETVGHHMTYKILTDDTHKVIHRSNVRPALDPDAPNLRLDPPDGEEYSPTPIIRSTRQSRKTTDGEELDQLPDAPNNRPQPQLIFIDPEELVGRTFLTKPQNDGQRFRARIVRAIDDHDANTEAQPQRIRFLCSMNNDAFEEIVSYNDIVHFLEADELEDNVFQTHYCARGTTQSSAPELERIVVQCHGGVGRRIGYRRTIGHYCQG